MDSQCLMVNCRRKAPDDEAFCAKHRNDTASIAAQFRAAQEVIAEQLKIRQQLEEERQTHLETITNLGAIIARLRKRAITHVCQPVGTECPHSPTGYHIVDTSMESGPNNCFHCEAPMPRGNP